MRTLSRHRVARLFAATLATLALASQLASFAHVVLLRHVTCTEHGELIEVGREQAIVATPTRETTQAVSASSSAGAHGHDHCLIVATRRHRFLVGVVASLDSMHVDAHGTIARLSHDEAPPPIAVLLLAPKSSPPLA